MCRIERLKTSKQTPLDRRGSLPPNTGRWGGIKEAEAFPGKPWRSILLQI
jgi:hypothetical protein